VRGAKSGAAAGAEVLRAGRAAGEGVSSRPTWPCGPSRRRVWMHGTLDLGDVNLGGPGKIV
jgi:hypothetical protein